MSAKIFSFTKYGVRVRIGVTIQVDGSYIETNLRFGPFGSESEAVEWGVLFVEELENLVADMERDVNVPDSRAHAHIFIEEEDGNLIYPYHFKIIKIENFSAPASEFGYSIEPGDPVEMVENLGYVLLTKTVLLFQEFEGVAFLDMPGQPDPDTQ